MVELLEPPAGILTGPVLSRVAKYPRLRYMGSKYRVIPHLVALFSEMTFDSVLDAFSGSGVVAYALKAMGKTVTANDFLAFPATVAKTTIENCDARLTPDDVDLILSSPPPTAADFIQRTFAGLYFPPDDLTFLDAAWAHIETLSSYKREVALAALCLAAARKQPRGVFTVTDLRYDDGRRFLRAPLRDLFCEGVTAYNGVIFDNHRPNRALCQNVFDVSPNEFEVVYLDPPYAPPRDDTDYIKRYHFLEGLCVYWRGLEILDHTATKKIAKRFTPFAYKRTIHNALREIFHQFRHSTIVLSYSSNSVPGKEEIFQLLQAEKRHVEAFAVPHRYSFGTHAAALRREVHEYIFVGR